jgi:CRP/FNR family transcriptional regulator
MPFEIHPTTVLSSNRSVREQQADFSRHSRKYAAKHILFNEGVEANAVYEVVEGTIMLYTISEDGRRTVIGFAQKGDYFGFIMRETHSYSAQTVGICTIRSIARSRLWQEIREHHRAAEKFLTLESNALEAARLHMTLLTCKAPSQRVAMFLQEMMRRQSFDGEAASDLHLPMTRADIADYLGLAVETVCRCLTHLKDDGVISIERRGEIKILDYEMLGFQARGYSCNGSSLEFITSEILNATEASHGAWTNLVEGPRSDLAAY